MKSRTRNLHMAKMALFFSSIVGLILVSLSSLWLNRILFNTERFTSITTSAFSEPSSRESVGNLVAAKIFENTPILKSALSDKLSSYVAGLLASDAATNSVGRIAREAQLLVTSPKRDPLVLELSSLKPIIVSAQELINKEEGRRRINVDDIPNSVTIIDTSSLPNFHQFLINIHIIGPLSFFAAVVLSGYWLQRGGRRNLYKRCCILMLVVIASAIIAIVIGPLAEPTFISLGRDAPTQTLLSNLYKSFTEPFRNQALWLGIIAAVTLISITTWHEFQKRYVLKLSITKK